MTSFPQCWMPPDDVVESVEGAYAPEWSEVRDSVALGFDPRERGDYLRWCALLTRRFPQPTGPQQMLAASGSGATAAEAMEACRINYEALRAEFVPPRRFKLGRAS